MGTIASTISTSNNILTKDEHGIRMAAGPPDRFRIARGKNKSVTKVYMENMKLNPMFISKDGNIVD
jgi:hypothetical protein